MKQVILISKRVAAEVREACRLMQAEDGGALFGSPEHGDVVAQVRAPAHAERSPVVIKLRGDQLDTLAKRVLTEHRAASWVGYWHLHFDLDQLSRGDLDQIAKLHGDPRVPSCGFVKVLAVKRGSEPIELKGFISPKRGIVEEVDLFEVDDVAAARVRLRAATAPPFARREHVLGTEPGAQRFAQELTALEADSYEIACDTAPQGVVVVLRHVDLHGDLALTIPLEGWERPPRVEHRVNGTARMLTSPLTTLLSAWSSAFTLSDLVAAARARSAWPKKPPTRAAAVRKGAA